METSNVIHSATDGRKKIKISIFGSKAVGKSCLIHAVKHREQWPQLDYTIGYTLDIIGFEIDSELIRFHFYETAGICGKMPGIRSALKNSDACIVVYDVSNIDSYNDVDDWIQIFKEDSGENLPILILANKVDLECQVKNKEAELRSKYKCDYGETTQNDIDHIYDLFYKFSRKVYKCLTFTIKLAVLGDAKVGKSTLLHVLKYGEKMSSSLANPTDKVCIVDLEINDTEHQVWLEECESTTDVSTIPDSLIKGSDGFILVYDVTNIDSFNNLENWIEMIKKAKGDDIKLFIIGAKNDLTDQKSDFEFRDLELYRKFKWYSTETTYNDTIAIKDQFIVFFKKVIEKTINIPITSIKLKQKEEKSASINKSVCPIF